MNLIPPLLYMQVPKLQAAYTRLSNRIDSAILCYMRMIIPEDIIELSSIFRENGFTLYLVGGAVRDYILGKDNNDYDFTTDAEPDDIKRMFRRTIDTGIKHGTVTVISHRKHYEITTFRVDGDYSDSRHPETVEFVKSLEEDLSRRDFTINAFAAELPDGKIIDMHGGMHDLRKKIIRAIGEPERRFEEDALRMMRGCRFSAQLGFSIEKETMKAMEKLSGTIRKVSAERIKEELFRLIGSEHPRMGLDAMRITGLMDEILPELAAAYGFEQGGLHSEDLYEHLILALEWSTNHDYSMSVRLASLLHDIGKTAVRAPGKDRMWTFYGHEEASAKMVDCIFRRLKTSNEERESVMHLVKNHMFSYTPDWSGSAVRRFIKRVGIENIDPLFELRIADMNATLGHAPDISNLYAFADRINEELDRESALSIKDLEINGTRMIELGIKPGPAIGKILAELLDEVIEDPSLNNKDYLEKRAISLSQCREQ